MAGAGVHHDPTPGPAGGEFLFGHKGVSLAWLANHPRWGVIALPLRSRLSVRAVDVPQLDVPQLDVPQLDVSQLDVSQLDEKYGWEFATKHRLAAELVTWFVVTLRSWGLKRIVWVVADGA